MRAFVALLTLAACSSQSAPSAPSPPPVAAPLTLAEHGAVSVGAPVPPGRAEPLSAILAAPDAYAGKTVVVEGHVHAACRKRGCWMELTPTKDGGPACRVRFKDYAFFVPTNSAGGEARLAGEVKVRTLAADEVAHLEGEGATLAKGADGTARAVEITATGVELMRL